MRIIFYKVVYVITYTYITTFTARRKVFVWPPPTLSSFSCCSGGMAPPESAANCSLHALASVSWGGGGTSNAVASAALRQENPDRRI